MKNRILFCSDGIMATVTFAYAYTDRWNSCNNICREDQTQTATNKQALTPTLTWTFSIFSAIELPVKAQTFHRSACRRAIPACYFILYNWSSSIVVHLKKSCNCPNPIGSSRSTERRKLSWNLIFKNNMSICSAGSGAAYSRSEHSQTRKRVLWPFQFYEKKPTLVDQTRKLNPLYSRLVGL